MKNSILKTKKSFNLSLLFVLLFMTINAQTDMDDSSNEFWNNVRFGGGIGLSFGDGFFSGTLAPSAIYQFSDSFAMGIGLNGTLNSRKNVFKSTIIGGSILALVNPIQAIQLSSEFEQLHVNRNFDEEFVSNVDDKYWYPALFLGAGYRTGNVTVGIRYDVLYDEEKSIYADPWIPFIRVYF